MRTNTLLSLFVAFAACTAFASPVEHKQEDVAHAVARSMMGSTNNIVSWESMQVERSPADPEVISEVEMEKRIVYNPPVTAPVSKQVWYAGREEVVKWKVDQDKIPAAANNFKVTIKLGYLPKNGEGGYNLKWTLAKDIAITDEEAEVTLPSDLETRHDYIIVVMGDSGNRSKKFTIKAAKKKTNEAVSCDSHPQVKPKAQSRDVKEEDTYASHMLGRDVQKSS